MTPSRTAAWALVLCTASACSFFGKADPMAPRYFDPVSIDLPGGERPSAAGAPGLRLGHVVGASHLRELIAYHVSERELGFYELRRWTERPEIFLRRSLSHALFEERGLVNTVASGPQLEVELTDFSELLKPTHAARVRARVVLVDPRGVLFERTFAAEQPVAAGDDFALVPAAMSAALERCVGEIADAVKLELSKTEAPAAQAPGAAPAAR